MEAVSDPAVSEVVAMCGSQLGKTEVCLNICGYHMAHDPSPILVVQPTLEMAQAWSKDRLAPMLRDTPTLQGKVADPRSRDSGNTTLHKSFPGGHLTVCGANSSSSLASRPIRIVLCDEVDRYPVSAGAEGDPVALARRRSATFWNRKILQVSSPTIKDQSRIEAAYKRSDRRQFWIPCHACGEFQTLAFRQVRWPENEPENAKYHCEHCDEPWTDAHRIKALRFGEWRAERNFKGTAGFHLSGLYSPWQTIAEAAQEFLVAKQSAHTLQGFINTFLAESWDMTNSQEEIPYEYLFARRESGWSDGEKTAPNGIGIITAGVDVQDDRLCYEIVGWGKGGASPENWSLEYGTIYGDPSSRELWERLDAMLMQGYTLENGKELAISAACIDSGGHYTQSVYAFCRPREGRRVFAIKGMGQEGRPIVGKPSRNNIGKVRLYPIGTFSAKEQIFAQLRIEEQGAGFCHFPMSRDRSYFLELLSERLATKHSKGYAKREWIKTRERNEALDCRVYALSALAILNVKNLDKLTNKINEIEEPPPPVPEVDEPPMRRNRLRMPKRSWINGF